ncbi:MFS transporter [Bacillus sp. NPDC077027]|uniref:MFS transporter n=1 Tax=Bacillus sp. NPDC077027 TaxID=3390548 RepID=UPI003D0004DB
MDRRRKQVVFISLITALSMIGDSMLYIVLPIYWREIGLSSIWEVGVLLSINRLIRIPLNPVVWWLYRYMSIKKGILIAILLAASTTMLYGISGFWLFLLCRCTWGISWTLLRMSGMRIIAEMDATSQGQFAGLYNGLYRLGSLFGMLFGGILASVIGFREVTLFFGLLTLTAFIFYFPLADVEKDGQKISKVKARQRVLELDMVKLLITGMLVALIIQGLFASTLSSILEERVSGGGIVLFGYVLGVSALSGGIQAMRWGWEPFIAPRTGKWFDQLKSKQLVLCWIFIFFGMMSGFSILLMPIGWFIVILLLLQLLSTMLTTFVDAFVLTKIASMKTKNGLIASYSLVQDVGAAIGPLCGYSLIQLYGSSGVFWMMIVICLLLLGLWMKRGHAKAVSSPSQ